MERSLVYARVTHTVADDRKSRGLYLPAGPPALQAIAQDAAHQGRCTQPQPAISFTGESNKMMEKIWKVETIHCSESVKVSVTFSLVPMLTGTAAGFASAAHAAAQ